MAVRQVPFLKEDAPTGTKVILLKRVFNTLHRTTTAGKPRRNRQGNFVVSLNGIRGSILIEWVFEDVQ